MPGDGVNCNVSSWNTASQLGRHGPPGSASNGLTPANLCLENMYLSYASCLVVVFLLFNVSIPILLFLGIVDMIRPTHCQFGALLQPRCACARRFIYPQAWSMEGVLPLIFSQGVERWLRRSCWISSPANSSSQDSIEQVLRRDDGPIAGVGSERLSKNVCRY